MLKILLAGPDKNNLSALEPTLGKHEDIESTRTESGKTALELAGKTSFDLIVADENLGDMTGLEFAGKLLLINPMINCAIVSSLSQEEFHEASEGLGLIGRIPPQPGEKNSEELIKKLRSIKGMLN